MAGRGCAGESINGASAGIGLAAGVIRGRAVALGVGALRAPVAVVRPDGCWRVGDVAAGRRAVTVSGAAASAVSSVVSAGC